MPIQEAVAHWQAGHEAAGEQDEERQPADIEVARAEAPQRQEPAADAAGQEQHDDGPPLAVGPLPRAATVAEEDMPLDWPDFELNYKDQVDYEAELEERQPGQPASARGEGQPRPTPQAAAAAAADEQPPAAAAAVECEQPLLRLVPSLSGRG